MDDRIDKQYSVLTHKASSNNMPVQRFFAGLTAEQLIAFMNELTPRYIPEQSIVKKIDDRETQMSFVVSGALEQITRHLLEKADRNLLKEYCYASEGEQNLIWSLWSSLLEK